jgi:hypothetical protein
MLKGLIHKYGKDKLNSLTKYPSILTLHKMEKGLLNDDLNVAFSEDEEVFATEKIDGTNVRIICYNDEYIVGSRERLLHYSGEMFYDPAQTIVESFVNMSFPFIKSDVMTVIYGELYGGKISQNSKQYGKDKVDFRVFDIATFDSDNLKVLNLSLELISNWREDFDFSSKKIEYGQSFFSKSKLDLLNVLNNNLKLVPEINFKLSDLSHEGVLDAMRMYLPNTNVALSDEALMKPEGIVLRNHDRSKIAKIRFEDYENAIRYKNTGKICRTTYAPLII